MLIVAACGDSSDSSDGDSSAPESTTESSTEAPEDTTAASTSEAVTTTAAPTTTAATTEAPTTTTARTVATIEESFVGAPTAPYPGPETGLENISVYFNNGSNGTIVAIYHGEGTADPTDICPGNSLQGPGGFEFISNAPLTEGACDGFPSDVGSVRICTGGVWLYETKIPNDSDGVLWGSVETMVDGQVGGVSAQALNSPGTPVIDYSADAYTVSAMFTNDGSTEIECEQPLT